MGGIEAVYIFNEHNDAILTHTFTSRPPPASTLLPLYLSHGTPRPSLIYLPSTNPPTLLFSILQDRLLFLAPTSTDTEPLLVLEFLHRVADALEEFVGAPLQAARIEANYDVVAQVLAEMCDGGLVGGTEANALRDVVETPSWVGKLLGGVALPGSSPALTSSGGLALHKPPLQPPLSTSGSAIPWRRSNVRHTSNELYVDIVETLQVTYAPSGRPLAAFAHGSIAFTSKVSGVPDLLLTLTTGSTGGNNNTRGDKVRRAMERPVFHPCVRLARWREHGELSFVPPDGRFVLAGYEVDLLDASAGPLAAKASSVNLPAGIEVRTGLGPAGNEFEVRLSVNARFATGGTGGGSGAVGGSSAGVGSGSAATSLSNHLGTHRPTSSRTGSGSTADAKSPLVEELVVVVPVPPAVRNISDLRPSKGEAHWSPGEAGIEWKISGKEAAALSSSSGAVLRCTVVGPVGIDDDDADDDGGMVLGNTANGMRTDTYDYDDSDAAGAYQSGAGASGSTGARAGTAAAAKTRGAGAQGARRARQNAALMPTSASLSFGVKGWLASGLKVDQLNIDVRKSKGLGEGVRPYKGVKYLTVSRGGIEVRC